MLVMRAAMGPAPYHRAINGMKIRKAILLVTNLRLFPPCEETLDESEYLGGMASRFTY